MFWTKSKSRIRDHFFERAHESFVVFNDVFRIIEVNAAFLTSLQLSYKDVIGKSILELIPDIESSGRLEVYRNVMLTGIPAFLDHVKVHAKYGRRVARLSIFKLDEGIGICALDITELHDSMVSLMEAREQLRVLNKRLDGQLQDLLELNKLFSEDLKPPLNNIKYIVDEIERDDTPMDTKEILYNNLHQLVAILSRKLNSLGDLISKWAEQRDNFKEELKLDTIIEEIKLILQQSISKSNVSISTDFKECPSIRYNPLYFSSIIQNLICFSLESNNSGTGDREQNAISIRSRKDGNGHVTVLYHDNSPGIRKMLHEAQSLPKEHGNSDIHGRFERVRDIITRNGGSIRVIPGSKSGTDIEIVLN